MRGASNRTGGTTPHDASRRAHHNLLLAALPDAERRRIFAACEEIEVAFGDTICARNKRIRYVYFPTGALISLHIDMDQRPGLEVGLIGREGAFGFTLALEVSAAPMRALVLHAGHVLRMEEGRFLRELARSAPLRKVVGRYLYVIMSQLAQMSACARMHVVMARLARWLLMMRDGSASDEFHLTQAFMASMLGVRRVGVTLPAGVLQKSRLVRYTRGRLAILDARALEAIACPCYALASATYARFMPRLDGSAAAHGN